MTNGQRLRSHLAERGTKIGWFAGHIHCSHQALTTWMEGRSKPQPIFREVIDRATDGAVPKDGW